MSQGARGGKMVLGMLVWSVNGIAWSVQFARVVEFWPTCIRLGMVHSE